VVREDWLRDEAIEENPQVNILSTGRDATEPFNELI